MNFRDIENNFPQKDMARNNFLDTLERLNLYKPEIPWEDIIMRSMKNFGVPNTLLVNPKTLAALQKQLNSDK
jgi:hypothetical protein